MKSKTSLLTVIVLMIPLGTLGALRADDFLWRSELDGGQHLWRTDTNWIPAQFPNSTVDIAHLSVELNANLSVDIGTTVVIGGLTFGGSKAPVSTVITGSGNAVLELENEEANAIITSAGVSGSVNAISATVHSINERVEFSADSTNDIRLEKFTFEGDSASLRSYMPAGVRAVVGDVSLLDPATSDPLQLFLNDGKGNHGTLEISGVISDDGQGGKLSIGVASGKEVSSFGGRLGTTVLSGDNTFSGSITANRGSIVLAHDNALGLGSFKQGNPSNHLGYNIISNDDSRKISNVMSLAQWQSFKGDHSIEWAGRISQSNSRGLVNLLPDGKTLTVSGEVYAVGGNDIERLMTFDGSGTTLVTSGLQNHFDSDIAVGGYRKRGSGLLVVSGGSSYKGITYVEAGALRFATEEDFGDTEWIEALGGAVGVDTGSFSGGLLARVTEESTGGISLAANESNLDLNYNNGGLRLVPKVSIAAPSDGITYTGTITPSNEDETYRLGGGVGTLTLPNQNQLTSDRSLVATNGGTVRLQGTNDYTGTTKVEAKYSTSVQEQARTNNRDSTSNQLYLPTTLAVTQLANGGEDSSIGRSSNAAANLLLQGSTFQYEGPGASTDRLFTVGSGGATIDASGDGPVAFASQGSIAMATATSREGAANSFRGRDIVTLNSTDGLIIGMEVGGLGLIPAGTEIIEVIDSTRVRISNNISDNSFEEGIVSFSDVDRTLTLTGQNSERNVLQPVVQDSEAATVSLVKDGPGTWVLSGDNTYTGETQVLGGTLLVDGTHSRGGTYTVSQGASLGGSGLIDASVTVDGTLLASASTLQIDGSLAFQPNSSLAVDLTGASMSTPLLNLNSINLESTEDALNVLPSDAAPGTYLLATYDGLLSGVFDSVSAGFTLDYDQAGQIILSVLGGNSLLGDFDNNGIVDLADLDLLTPEIASGQNDVAFDVNSDAFVDQTDLSTFLSGGLITSGNKLAGDADLDGQVGFPDFLRLSSNFGGVGGFVWSDGDFDANGAVQFPDFLILSSNFGSSAAATASVPEPRFGLFCISLIAILGLRLRVRIRS